MQLSRSVVRTLGEDAQIIVGRDLDRVVRRRLTRSASHGGRAESHDDQAQDPGRHGEKTRSGERSRKLFESLTLRMSSRTKRKETGRRRAGSSSWVIPRRPRADLRMRGEGWSKSQERPPPVTRQALSVQSSPSAAAAGTGSQRHANRADLATFGRSMPSRRVSRSRQHTPTPKRARNAVRACSDGLRSERTGGCASSRARGHSVSAETGRVRRPYRGDVAPALESA